jgi:hypothetical protein
MEQTSRFKIIQQYSTRRQMAKAKPPGMVLYVCALWSVRWPPNPPRTTSRDRRLHFVVLLV